MLEQCVHLKTVECHKIEPACKAEMQDQQEHCNAACHEKL